MRICKYKIPNLILDFIFKLLIWTGYVPRKEHRKYSYRNLVPETPAKWCSVTKLHQRNTPVKKIFINASYQESGRKMTPNFAPS